MHVYTVYVDLSSIYSIVCVCDCTGEPGLCSAELTRQPAETQNIMLTVIYSATLHDREIRFVDLTFWNCTSSKYCMFCVCQCVAVCAHWCTVSVCLCVVTVCNLVCVCVS